jgi:site-specific recombinase XerD
MRLTEAIEALLIATRADGRSQSTVAAYRGKLSHLVTFLGDVEVEAITVDGLRRYIAYQMSEHTLYPGIPGKERTGTLSPFTVATRVRAVKRLFNFLEVEGRIETNPARRIRTPKPKPKPKGIGFDDVLALLETASGGDVADVRDTAIILLLCDTGCRVGGLCGLRVDDVNLETGLAIVREKGDKMRYLMFTPQTAEALRAWLAVKPKDRGDFVFVSLKRKGALTPSGVRQMLTRRAEQAGIEGAANPHAFRHGFAKFYLLDGGDLGTLADILGHSSVEVTKDYYGVFTLQELQAKHRRHSPITQMFEGVDKNGK